jgi:ABC-type glycerol-3-phosphate transport system substrate-binding protein
MLRTRPLITVLCLILLLAACADDDGDSPNSAAPTATPGIAIDTAQSILVWHPFEGAERDTLEAIRLDFEVAYPHLDVRLEARDPATLRADFETAVRDGAGPDLLFGSSQDLVALANQGLLQPLSHPLIDDLSSTLTEAVAQATEIQGVPYAAVYSASYATLYFNRTLVPASPETYDALLTTALDVGLLVPPSFSATSGLFFSPGRRLLDPDGQSQLTQIGLETYLEKVRALAQQRGVTITSDPAAFLAGEAGMMIGFPPDYAPLRDALGDDLGVMAFPPLDGNNWNTLFDIRPVMLSLNSTAEATEAASLFMVFLNRAEAQADWFAGTGHGPVNPAMLTDPDLQAAWREIVVWGTPAPLSAAFDTVMRPALDQAVQAVALDGIEPAEAAAAALDALGP